MAYTGSVGVLNRPVVSAVGLLDARTIMPGIVDNSNEMNFAKMMMIMGRFVPTYTHQYHHFMHGDLNRVGLATGSTITGSGTATLTIPLTAGTSGFFRPEDEVRLTGDGKNGVVLAVSTSGGVDTLTVQSVDGSNITFANTNAVIWAGRAGVEGGSSPVNIRYLPTSNTNQVKISNEVDVITDVTLMNQLEVIGDDGQKYIKGIQHERKVLNMQKGMSLSMIEGQISTHTFDTVTSSLIIGGKNLQTTRGLDQYVLTQGAQSAITTAGAYVEADLDALNAVFFARKIPTTMLALGSGLAQVPIKKYLKNLGSSGVTSVRMNVDGNSVNLNVEQFITTAGFTIDFVNDDQVFNDPTTISAPGNTIGKRVYFLPKDHVSTTAGMKPRISVRYLSHDHLELPAGQNRKWKDVIMETYTGAFAPIPTSDVRELRTNWVAYTGLEIIGASQTAYAQTIA